MKRITWKHIGIFFLCALLVFIVDRYTKEFLFQYYVEDIVLIPDFLRITYQTNAGVAFSISLPYIFQLILFPVLLIFGMYAVIRYLQLEKPFVLIIVGCIVGGAASNFSDRILYQHVIDYISVWIYPVFNLADVFITVGIFLLIIFYGKIKRV